MEGEEKPIGLSINVTMGDGNKVGNIGHIFNVYERPPNPNAIMQNGKVAGDVTGEVKDVGSGLCLFERLHFVEGFRPELPFNFKQVEFVIVGVDQATTVGSNGRPKETTLWNCRARVVGTD